MVSTNRPVDRKQEDRAKARKEVVELANLLRNPRLNPRVLGMRHINEAVFRLRQRQPGQHAQLLEAAGFNPK